MAIVASLGWRLGAVAMQGTYTAGVSAPLQNLRGDMRLTHGLGWGNLLNLGSTKGGL
jgi:hypothetical protein